MQTLSKRSRLRGHHLVQTISTRQYSNTSTHIKPRRNTSIHHDPAHKPKTNYASKTYKSSKDQSARSIRVYDKVSNTKRNELEDILAEQQTLSKKMRKKLQKQGVDISANFGSNRTSDDGSIHGIIQMFDDDTSAMDSDQHWYNNPQHIDEVETFLQSSHLPFDYDGSQTSYVTDDITDGDKIKMSKRMQLKLNRKLKTIKRRGDDMENMNRNELITRNNTQQQNICIEGDNKGIIKNENEDIALKVWDSINKEFTHSPTPLPPSSKAQKKRKKVANKWKRYEQNTDITDLRMAAVSPHWLHYEGIDPVILDQLSHRLPTASRHFSKTPQGLYSMNNKIRKDLQKTLVSEYWPTGWAEKQEDQIFAQRLFNAVPIKYDRRKVLRYIANEFPLSLSVNYRILKELAHRMPDFKPKGLIDFGQGPGCASLAAMEVFGDSLKCIYGIETSNEMRAFGSTILSDYKNQYHIGYLENLYSTATAKEQPLVICSFALSEISGGIDGVCEYLDQLWLSTRKVLVLVEAGTVDGYNLINFARSYLLSKYPPSNDVNIPGTYTIAPCPHDKQCPLSSQHICRFVQRIDRHQVPTRCMFKAQKKRTKVLDKKNRKKKQATLRDKRKIDEIQFPYSYCVLGKGASPRLISPESNMFSQHFPNYFMNHKQAEHAAYFWPRIITPPKYRQNNVYLHLCLPDAPVHAKNTTEPMTQQEGMMRLLDDKIERRQETQLIPNGRVCGKLKLDYRKSAKHHINILDEEGIDEKEYGYLEKWLIAKSDNELQMYMDAKRSKWGDLWPWPSPLVGRCPSLRLHPSTAVDYKCIRRYSRPKFREYFTQFRKDCGAFVHHRKNIDLISDEECGDAL
eukprot:204797_1